MSAKRLNVLEGVTRFRAGATHPVAKRRFHLTVQIDREGHVTGVVGSRKEISKLKNLIDG